MQTRQMNLGAASPGKQRYCTFTIANAPTLC
jgi:hypothetical protein